MWNCPPLEHPLELCGLRHSKPPTHERLKKLRITTLLTQQTKAGGGRGGRTIPHRGAAQFWEWVCGGEGGGTSGHAAHFLGLERVGAFKKET